MSVEKSNPLYGFPQAKRDDGHKVFMGELTKLNNAGKMSPGPVYRYHDEVKFQKVSIILYHIIYLHVSHLVGHLELPNVKEQTDQNMISMKMQLS